MGETEKGISKVASKILMIMEDIGSVSKDGKIEFGNTKYKYMAEETLTPLVKKAMIERKVIIVPVAMKELPAPDHYSKAEVTYRIIDCDSGEHLDVTVQGEGQDSGDKKTAKCMTMAFKYLQRQVFFISTGDDPDHDASGKVNEKIGKNGAKSNKASPGWEETQKPLPPDYWMKRAAYTNIKPYKNDKGDWCRIEKVLTAKEKENHTMDGF